MMESELICPCHFLCFVFDACCPGRAMRLVRPGGRPVSFPHAGFGWRTANSSADELGKKKLEKAAPLRREAAEPENFFSPFFCLKRSPVCVLPKAEFLSFQNRRFCRNLISRFVEIVCRNYRILICRNYLSERR